MHWRSFVFVVSLFCCKCRCPLTVFFDRCKHTVAQVLSLHSTHSHHHVSCARWVTSSTSPFISSLISSSLSSSCSSCCFTLSTSWCRGWQACALPLRSWAPWPKRTPPQEEDVLVKYRKEESKREAWRGGSAPLEWRRVPKNKKYRIRCREDCWASNFLFVHWKQLAASAKQAGGLNGRRRDQATAKNCDYERSDKENRIKRKNGR